MKMPISNMKKRHPLISIPSENPTHYSEKAPSINDSTLDEVRPDSLYTD